MKKAFTLVEMLLVIAIIGVLAGIVMTAVLGSLRSARTQRAKAGCTLLENAIATAYAQDSKGEWPAEIEAFANQGKSAVLSDDAAQSVFREIVKKSIGKQGSVNPLIDPTGLFVARKGIQDGKGYGLPYNEARRGGKKGKLFGSVQQRQAIGVDQMVFGYQGRATGKFRRFTLIFYAETDSVKVSTCCHQCATANQNEIPDKAKCKNPKCPYCHRIEDQD